MIKSACSFALLKDGIWHQFCGKSCDGFHSWFLFFPGFLNIIGAIVIPVFGQQQTGHFLGPTPC
jgi:hypothetical protein